MIALGRALPRADRHTRITSAGTPASREGGRTLYGRPGCHLCDEARAAILELAGDRIELREVDIEADDRLLSAYLERIPVVEVDGRVVSELEFDRDAFSRATAYCRPVTEPTHQRTGRRRRRRRRHPLRTATASRSASPRASRAISRS